MEKNTASISVITNYLMNITPELMRYEMKLGFAFSWWVHHANRGVAVRGVQKGGLWRLRDFIRMSYSQIFNDNLQPG